MKLQKRYSLTGMGFTLPFLAGFALLYLIPFVWSVQRTFTAGAGGTRFVGLRNYIDLFRSAAFRLAAGNTLRFIVVGVPLLMALSFALALALYHKFRGASFFRSAFLLPMVLPVAAVVTVVRAFFGDGGFLVRLLDSLGLPLRAWMDSELAFPLLIGLYIWKNCGYNMVLFLAGLSAIPQDFNDAAACEGATEGYILRHITMPLMIPNFFFVFVISVINAFKSFREAYLLGGSMPHESIYMLQHFMNNNFQNLNYPRLCTAALLIFAVIFLLVLLLFRVKRKYEVAL
ncbi:MAG: carbohydrate ABC transporter permease [Faecousia sp.]